MELRNYKYSRFAKDKHKAVDDTPYGGGSGMLIRPDVLANSLDERASKGEKIIYLTPKGKKIDQIEAKKLAKQKKLNFICGHFEGIDQRVISTETLRNLVSGIIYYQVEK